MVHIARYLAGRGYDIWFVAGSSSKLAVEQAGCAYIQAIGPVGQPARPQSVEAYGKTGIQNLLFLGKELWAGQMASGLENLRCAMSTLRRERPNREVVMVIDTFFSGIVPLKLGADLPEGYDKLPKTLGISLQGPIWTTLDRGPPGFGLPYENTKAIQRRNVVISQLAAVVAAPVTEATNFMLRACGVYKPIDSLFADGSLMRHLPVEPGIMCHDTALHMSIPSLDYPANGLPPNFKYAGIPPLRPLDPGFQFPSWFQAITANSVNAVMPNPDRRKIIVVSQGTVSVDYSDLVIPSIKGLADRNNVILIAILGVKGATLDIEFPDDLPKNTFVADHFPYGTYRKQWRLARFLSQRSCC
jgi:hypothetical protein